jgi:hypothetical protein
MEMIIGKFETEREFKERDRSGFITNAEDGYPYKHHTADCHTLDIWKNYMGERRAKYLSRDLDALRQLFPNAEECKKCLGKSR